MQNYNYSERVSKQFFTIMDLKFKHQKKKEKSSESERVMQGVFFNGEGGVEEGVKYGTKKRAERNAYNWENNLIEYDLGLTVGGGDTNLTPPPNPSEYASEEM